MKLQPSPRFKRAFEKLPPEVKQAVSEALRQFLANPRHPSLHFEKLKGSVYRTVRVDRKKYRIVMIGVGDEMTLVDVDRHDKVDRIYG